MKKEDWPAQNPSVVIAVEDIKASMKDVTKAGGKVLGDPMEIPGVGQYEAQAIGNLDVPPILVGAMFTAFFVVLFSALSDIVYAVLDPRIRLTG